MKIDKKMLDKVLTLNDDQLWKAIQLAASKSGLNNVKNLEKPRDMSKLRNTLSGLTDSDIARVTELLKKGKDNG
ncbi:MAG: hypothetical protein J6B45_03960 [Clostridia bacterium]|nr:hypothetical protein [Clostridia bacterium]